MSTSIDDLEFPRTVLTRLIKAGLPENIAIQKEARQAVTRSATVFVSYLAATANDCAREAGHKTITTSDIVKALEAIGLGDFVDRLMADLETHTRLVKEKRDLSVKNKAADEGGDEEQDHGGDENDDDEEEDGDEDEDAMDSDTGNDGEPHQDLDQAAGAADAAPESVVASPNTESMEVDDPDVEAPKRLRTE